LATPQAWEPLKRQNKPKLVFSPAQFRIQRLDGERQMREPKTRGAGDLSIAVTPTDTIFVFGTRAFTITLHTKPCARARRKQKDSKHYPTFHLG
jgi:hypothetical protein